MTADEPKPRPFSLKRWSQRKLETAQAGSAPPPVGTAAPAPAPSEPRPTAATAPIAESPPLPPVESLTIDSDFTRFLDPKVDESLKRQALKQLFRDPRFNVMDGLDTYIDDYSQPDPISPELVRQMVQGRHIFDPPKTRVNAQGAVEDVRPADADGAGASVPPGAQVLPATPASAVVPADPFAAPAAGGAAPQTSPVPPQEPEPVPR